MTYLFTYEPYGPDSVTVSMNGGLEGILVARIGMMLLLETPTSTRGLPDGFEMPDDPLARLEMTQSAQKVSDEAESIAEAGLEVAVRVLAELSTGSVVISSDEALACACALNGVYVTMRSASLEEDGYDYQPGTPGDLNIDAELAELFGNPVDEDEDESIDAAGWDEYIALAAAFTSDFMEVAGSL